MIIYVFSFVFIGILHFTQLTKQLKKYKLIFFIFAVFYLILFAGLRELGVGADDYNYYNVFKDYVPTPYDWIFGSFVYDIKDGYMEPGYIFLNSLLKSVTDAYHFLFLMIAFLSVGIASYNYHRYAKYVFLTLLLFFVHTYLYRDMNQIRSAVAAAIGLFLISQIYNKEHFKVFFTLFIASLFHVASLSLIFAYLLSFIKLTKYRVIFLYCIAVFFGVIGISQLVIQLVPGGAFLTSKLYSYTANEEYANAISLFDITNIKNSFVLFMIVIFWDRLEKVVPYFKVIVLFYLMAVFIRIGFYDLGVIAARISTFFGIVEVIIIPYFIYIFRQKIIISLLIVLYAFTILYLNLFIKEGRFPYEMSVF